MKKAIFSVILAALIVASAPMAMAASPQEGIDVSHYDGSINWQAVKTSGHGDFAYIKALDGANTRDSYFTANYQGAANAGVAWGPYQFFHPYSVESAQEQAENYWNIIQGTGYSLTPVVDVEVYDGVKDSTVFRTRLQAFLTRFEQLSGVKPIIYTMRSFIRDNAMNTYFSAYKLWQADPDRESPIQTGWPISIWQYSWSGQVDGITAEEVDLNRMMDGTVGSTGTQQSSPVSADTTADVYPVDSLPYAINSRAGANFDVLDSSGNKVYGRSIDKGDPLIILSVNYSLQLAEVLYPSYSQGQWIHAYIHNREDLLHNVGYNKWQNGSTNEAVYDASGNRIGTIYPNEKATKLYKQNGKTAVLYTTSKGAETKSGYVAYAGLN